MVHRTEQRWRRSCVATASLLLCLRGSAKQFRRNPVPLSVPLKLRAGLDKFTHILVNWDMYLAPVIARMSPVPAHTLMMVIGVIEIIAGILVAIKPRIGAYVVAAWLCGIIINLLLLSGYYDIALRDFGLALGAIALGRLSINFDR